MAEGTKTATPRPWSWFSRIDQEQKGELRYVQVRGEKAMKFIMGADKQGMACTVGLSPEVDDANADLIVRAVNSFDALVSALERVREIASELDASVYAKMGKSKGPTRHDFAVSAVAKMMLEVVAPALALAKQKGE